MSDKPAVSVVKSDMVRHRGSGGAYRKVIGIAHTAGRVKLWLEDPTRPRIPDGAPMELPVVGGMVDAQPPGAA